MDQSNRVVCYCFDEANGTLGLNFGFPGAVANETSNPTVQVAVLNLSPARFLLHVRDTKHTVLAASGG
jgi:hypothetical protein